LLWQLDVTPEQMQRAMQEIFREEGEAAAEDEAAMEGLIETGRVRVRACTKSHVLELQDISIFIRRAHGIAWLRSG
jgi:hypothetical protein